MHALAYTRTPLHTVRGRNLQLSAPPRTMHALACTRRTTVAYRRIACAGAVDGVSDRARGAHALLALGAVHAHDRPPPLALPPRELRLRRLPGLVGAHTAEHAVRRRRRTPRGSNALEQGLPTHARRPRPRDTPQHHHQQSTCTLPSTISRLLAAAARRPSAANRQQRDQQRFAAHALLPPLCAARSGSSSRSSSSSSPEPSAK